MFLEFFVHRLLLQIQPTPTFRWSMIYPPKLAGHCSSTLEVRLLIFWEARKVKRGGELMGVHMLLLDAKISISNNGGPTVCSGVKLENIRKSYKGVTVLKYVPEK
ncbi:hypothetical protein Bca52824_017151 [Brassica carinata]|uniref:Uncharacterized protein n=1 Tax=Brassica carinata TaxID=52824 RepID=A0A8X7VMN1_BRACI|nr:hypothetical protein Bca52824_017151 [Brassica carinata]